MAGQFLRTYSVTLDATTAGSTKVRISLRKAGTGTFATGSDWSPASGDVKVSKDGGAEANIGTLPAYSNGQWEFVLSGTELTAKNIHVRISNAAVDDEDFNIETFGNASAMYPTNYEDGQRLGLAALPSSGVLAVKPAVTLALADVGTVDGITFSSMLDALLAFIGGKSTVTDNGDGTKTVVYKKQDGTTTKLTVTFTTATGARGSTTVS